MAAAPMLTTPRAILRPLGTADLDAVHALWTDPDVRRYLWDDVVITREQADGALTTSEQDFAVRGFGLWGIALADGGALLGFCGARRASGGAPELLYGLLGTAWGQGLATECAAAVLDHLFGPLGLPEAVALTDATNAASVRVMERLGMTFERRGDHHGLDTVFYRLRAADWRARRIVVGRAVPEDEVLLLSLTPRLAEFPRPAWRSAVEIDRSDHAVLLAALHRPSPDSLVLVAERPAGQPGGMALVTTQTA
jgi:ribosomal-protein-alanine N-acetyltransferase